jgi:Fur family ferric uptake transcriptional regulator
LSHHEIEATIGERRAVDRVTLYRVLDWLTANELAHKLAGDDRVWRFAAVHAEDRHGEHAHFQCSECGKVVCLASAARLPNIPLPGGYRRREVEVTVRGWCDRCAGSR